MYPGDIPKTAFVCHLGKFEFLRIPFGICNTPAVFQQLMQKLFRDGKDYCSPYMDDLIIYRLFWEEHVKHVHRVL